jgi:hypothetical protein
MRPRRCVSSTGSSSVLSASAKPGVTRSGDTSLAKRRRPPDNLPTIRRWPQPNATSGSSGLSVTWAGPHPTRSAKAAISGGHVSSGHCSGESAKNCAAEPSVSRGRRGFPDELSQGPSVDQERFECSDGERIIQDGEPVLPARLDVLDKPTELSHVPEHVNAQRSQALLVDLPQHGSSIASAPQPVLRADVRARG